jgi:hypothetical protein
MENIEDELDNSVEIEQSEESNIKENQDKQISGTVREDFQSITNTFLENILSNYSRSTEFQTITFEKIFKGVNFVVQRQKG